MRLTDDLLRRDVEAVRARESNRERKEGTLSPRLKRQRVQTMKSTDCRSRAVGRRNRPAICRKVETKRIRGSIYTRGARIRLGCASEEEFEDLPEIPSGSAHGVPCPWLPRVVVRRDSHARRGEKGPFGSFSLPRSGMWLHVCCRLQTGLLLF